MRISKLNKIFSNLLIDRRVFNKLLVIGVIQLLMCMPGCADTPSLITKNSGDNDLAQLLETMRAKGRQTALAAAVIVDNKIMASAAVGTRKYGTEKWVTVDDKFIIASCGKAFTATLAAVLVEEGLLSWDTTIQNVFPGLMMREEYAEITLQQLLSHRAGLPKNFVADLKSKKSYTPTSGRFAFLVQIVQTKPAFTPGTVLFYSNSGYMLAGVMLEKVSGQEFTKLMSEKIFKPLNLTTAGYGSPADQDPTSQPWGHFWDKSNKRLKAVKKDDPHWIDPAGNVCISIKDWAKFIIQHMSFGQNVSNAFLKPATLNVLHTPQDNLGWAYDENYYTFWENDFGWPLTSANYALGWYVTKEKDGESLLNHGGTSRAFQAEVYMAPNKKKAILLATNSRMGHIHLYRTAIKINEKYSLKIDLPQITGH